MFLNSSKQNKIERPSDLASDTVTLNMSSGEYNNESMMHQAQHVWTMLDEMANNNPAAYREFINKQLQEGRQQMAPPEPHMCIKTKILKPQAGVLYINVCGWSRIPAPKTEDSPVTVTGTSVQTACDDAGSFSVVSVAFNPDIVKKFGRNAENPVDRDTLVQLSMDYIEAQQKMKISRGYKILKEDVTYKGVLSDIQAGFVVKHNESDKKFEKDLNELENSFGPLAAGGKDSLLNQLKNIAVGDNQSNPENTGINQSGLTMSNSKAPVKCGLIEEIDSSDRLAVPRYELNSHKSGLSDVLELRIMLPNVRSVAECELDISEDDISMTVPQKYQLYVKLPKIIDDNDSTAKFSKKMSVLTITMPVR